jgi:hypothetical protein
MNWTQDERLALIYELACLTRENLRRGETLSWKIHLDMERIQFLCRMPAMFLEANKSNYADVIASAQGASHE